ncbi:MAG: ABC transporter permease [Bacteroidota bacterium]
MFRHTLTLSLRVLRRDRFFTGLNIAGLAVGLACCTLILLHVRDEASYDRFFDNADRIVRIVEDYATEAGTSHLATTPVPLAPVLAEGSPDLEQVARFFPAEVLVSAGPDRRFMEPRFAYADSTFFEVFAMPFRAGEPASALDRPMSVVLTRTTAERYFGNADPLGERLTIRGEDGPFDFTVTGVIEDVPPNSHLAVDFLASFSSLETTMPYHDSWWHPRVYTYGLLQAGAPAETLEADLPDLVASRPNGYRYTDAPPAFTVQALTDIHLRSQREAELKPNGSAAYVSLFTLIAFGVLGIACVNFMNLATARAAKRAREVGVRKAIGAGRGQLAMQHLGESMVMAVLAGVLAMGLAAMALPAFNNVTGTSLTLSLGVDEVLLLGALVLATGLIAGSYPAFVLSRFQPVQTLRGMTSTGPASEVLLRRGLTAVQFALSMALVVGSLAVYRQLDLLREDRLGFDKERVVTLPLRDQEAQIGHETLEEALRRVPGVQAVSASSGVPGMQDGYASFEIIPERAAIDSLEIMVITVGHEFREALGLEVVAGRDFDDAFPSDTERGFIITAAAARTLGWSEPVGERLTLDYYLDGQQSKAGEIVGVVRDFQYHALREAPRPVLFHLLPGTYYNDVVAVRLGPGDPRPSLDAMREAWAAFAPDRPFEYAFLDDQFDALYRSEARLGVLTTWFTVLAVGIACLGLLGLAAHATERRRKEIGVRKVLGASATRIVRLLVSDFLRPVLAAVVLAVPLAYVIVDHWLDGFAERITLGPDLFGLAVGLGLLVAAATVVVHAIRAATADPVRALRPE